MLLYFYLIGFDILFHTSHYFFARTGIIGISQISRALDGADPQGSGSASGTASHTRYLRLAGAEGTVKLV